MLKKIIFLFIVYPALWYGCQSGKNEKQRFLIKGNEALAHKKYKEALRYYNEALKLDSCYTDALSNIGIVHYENGRYSEAIQYYNAAIACKPDFWKAYANRANAYYQRNELYRALDDFEYLQTKIPDSSSVYFGLGLVNTRLHKYDQAIKDYNQAIFLDSDNAEALINRGTVYYFLDKFAKAEDDLDRALTINPKHANAYNALALLRADQEQYQDALIQIEEALRLEPYQPYFLNNRGYIKFFLNDKDAVNDINRSIVIDPSNGWAYRNKALWHIHNDRYREALDLLHKAEKMDDFIDKLYYYKGLCLYLLGEKTKACQAWKKSIERNENESQKVLDTLQYPCFIL